jgi:flagellin
MTVINTNVPSLTAQRNLATSGSSLATSLQRLSSGLRINSAKDDAAGLAISERMSGQIRGLDQARRNANDGISLAQTAESSLDSAGKALQRIRELAVQSSNSSNSSSDRQALQDEVTQLTGELDRIAQTTEFNGLKLLDGSFSSSTFQVGANAFQTITTTSANFRSTVYGLNRVDGTVSQAIATTGSASSVAAGSLTLNGYVGATSVNIAAGESAKTTAANVNAVTNATGITASARSEFDATFVVGQSYAIEVNAANSATVTVSFSVTANTADGLASAVQAFNEQSGKTGVTAKVNATNDGVTLTNEAGENIRLDNVSATTTAMLTAAGASVSNATSIVVAGKVTFDSSRSFNMSGSNNILAGGSGTYGSSLAAVSTLDVTTFTNSTKALAIVDSALTAVNAQRAKFGAVQSRFENTISNLQSTAENLSAARSRIRDTDFAAETANLSRNQVLQQAGTAMLAQANQLPQQVLSLLR